MPSPRKIQDLLSDLAVALQTDFYPRDWTQADTGAFGNAFEDGEDLRFHLRAIARIVDGNEVRRTRRRT